MKIFFFIVLFLLMIYFSLKEEEYAGNDSNSRRYIKIKSNKKLKEKHRSILKQYVEFYNHLNYDLKIRFEVRILEFLHNYRITGIRTKITNTDRLLIASSAVIPTYRIDNWRYTCLDEVIVYPTAVKWPGLKQSVVGLVGEGVMEGKMILSKKALYQSFEKPKDGKHVGIHEFLHLIDKEDGQVDGIPHALLNYYYTVPWLNLIERKVSEVMQGESDLRKYALNHQNEFLTIASEYFFETPEKMKQNHPKLYMALSEIFQQDPATRMEKLRKNLIKKSDMCLCQSGLKFKKCCGREHFGFRKNGPGL